MKNTDEKVSIRISRTQSQALETLCRQTKKSKSQLIRNFIDKGLGVDSFEQDEQRMLLAIRKAVNLELERPIERIAAITAKGTHTSAAAYFTLIELLKLLISEDAKNAVPQLASKARRLGIAYLKEKSADIDMFLENTIK